MYSFRSSTFVVLVADVDVVPLVDPFSSFDASEVGLFDDALSAMQV